MITRRELLPVIDTINPNTKTISIMKESIIEEDGVEISRTNHRCAFAPGDIEEVKKYMVCEKCPELDYLQAIWTDDVVKAYKESIARHDV